MRYLGIAPDGEIVPSTRMKGSALHAPVGELPQGRPRQELPLEAYEKELGNLPQYIYLGDAGLDSKFGWASQGFIEDPKDELRAATSRRRCSAWVATRRWVRR